MLAGAIAAVSPLSCPAENSTILRLAESEVRFTSNAPLEIIRAATTEMAGLINTDDGSFAFRIPMQSFKGFNSPLQMEHFHENYMESNDFRYATFQGRIIEDVDFSQTAVLEVRAKGQLDIHGISQERIIKATIDITGPGAVTVRSEFTVPLSDHNITIPKIVEQKIAREIAVEMNATFAADEAP